MDMDVKLEVNKRRIQLSKLVNDFLRSYLDLEDRDHSDIDQSLTIAEAKVQALKKKQEEYMKKAEKMNKNEVIIRA